MKTIRRQRYGLIWSAIIGVVSPHFLTTVIAVGVGTFACVLVDALYKEKVS